MKKGKHIPKKIFDSYLSGNLSDDELMQNKKWRAVEKEALLFIKQQLDNARCEEPINVFKAWEQQQKICVLDATKPATGRFINPYWRYVAAAAVLVLTISLSFVFLRKESVKDVIIANNTLQQQEKPFAYLELSDGKIVDLEKSDAQEIEEYGVNIQLSQQGIVYNQKEKKQGDRRLNTLKVPSKGEYMLTLSDGTIAWLNSGSELVFPVSFGDGNRKVQLKGEAYFEVTKRKNSRFIVETKRGEVEVFGTSFNISSYDDDRLWHVTLVEGVVNVTTSVNGVAESLQIHPSQQVLLNGNKAPEMRTVKTNLYTSWREGIFIFEDMPLNDIAMRLERWYDIKIMFNDSLSAYERYTGVFRKNENVDIVAKTILNTNKVILQRDGKQINIWAKSNMH